MAACAIWVGDAGSADVAGLARLHHDHLAYHVQFDPRYEPMRPPAYEAVFRELLRDPFSGVLVARWGQERVGFVSLRLHEDPAVAGRGLLDSLRRRPRHTGQGTLVDLYVATEHRRHGVGTRLVSAAMAWFTEHGVRDVSLGVMAANDAGRAFWQRQGFDEYRVTMRRHLDPTDQMGC